VKFLAPVEFNFMGLIDLFKEKSEEKEYRKVAKAVKEKKADWLGRWLQKFSVEGTFWLKEKKEKNNWL